MVQIWKQRNISSINIGNPTNISMPEVAPIVADISLVKLQDNPINDGEEL